MLKPKNVTLYFICNILLLLFRLFIFTAFKFHLSLFTNIQSYNALGIFEYILTFGVFLGLITTLTQYHENKLPVIGLVIYIIFQTCFIVHNMMTANGHAGFIQWSNRLPLLSGLFVIGVCVSLFFVRSVHIKSYYRYFGILLLLCYFLIRILPTLYDDFGLTWILINPALLSSLPFFASLLLFKKLSQSSHIE